MLLDVFISKTGLFMRSPTPVSDTITPEAASTRSPKLRRRRPWLWPVLITLCIALAAGWYFLRPKPFTVRLLTAPVVQGDLENSVLASGTVQARQLVNVGAQVSGQVRQLYVALGDPVRKGQLIAQIDSVTQENALKNAQSSVTNLQAQRAQSMATLRFNEAQLGRYGSLLRENAVSRSEYGNIEAAYKASQAQIAAYDAQIQQARNQISTARQNLGYTRITAPIAGTVVAVVTDEGQTVNANQTAPTIVKLADLSTMTVEAQISEADVTKVKPGQPVYFTLLGNPDKKYYATLRAIEPASTTIATDNGNSSNNSQAIYYNALFDVPNADGSLRIDMTAQVYVVLEQAKNILQIPISALSFKPQDRRASKSDPGDATQPDGAARTGRGDDTKRRTRRGPPDLTPGTVKTVYVLDTKTPDAQPKAQKILIGLNDRINVEVRHGLTAGDQVVIGDSQGDKTPSSRGRGSGMGGPGGPR